MCIKEIWKDINGYNGDYQISNFGRVKSKKFWNGSNERILKQALSYKGYFYVSLCKKGKVNIFLVHRLVAIHFIDNPLNLPQINHKNENKSDNRVCNLEWCTNKYNMNYGNRLNKQIQKCSKSVLCVETGVIYPSSAEASRKNFPIRQGNIILCCQGKNKTAGGYHWKYSDN